MERRDEALGAAESAIAHAKQLGLPLPAKALGFRGWARCEQGDHGGVEDLAVALDAARDQGLGRESAMVYCNMGEALAAFAGPAEGLRVHREGREFSERRGIRQFVLWLARAIVEDLVWTGRWDEALAEADSLAPLLEDAGDVLDLMAVRANQLLIHTQRRSQDQIEALAPWFEKIERGVEPEIDACCDVAMALSRLADGKSDEALKLIATFRAVPGSMAFERAWRLPAACRIALGAGSVELALRLVDGVEPGMPVHQHALTTTSALLDEARGQHESAAATFAAAALAWHDFGVPYEEAQALLGQGRCLIMLGRAPEASAPLASAHEIFARLGATPALEETQVALAAAR
jgi:tetratricopeptide (TPR) repeat protein